MLFHANVVQKLSFQHFIRSLQRSKIWPGCRLTWVHNIILSCIGYQAGKYASEVFSMKSAWSCIDTVADRCQLLYRPACMQEYQYKFCVQCQEDSHLMYLMSAIMHVLKEWQEWTLSIEQISPVTTLTSMDWHFQISCLCVRVSNTQTTQQWLSSSCKILCTWTTMTQQTEWLNFVQYQVRPSVNNHCMWQQHVWQWPRYEETNQHIHCNEWLENWILADSSRVSIGSVKQSRKNRAFAFAVCIQYNWRDQTQFWK